MAPPKVSKSSSPSRTGAAACPFQSPSEPLACFLKIARRERVPADTLDAPTALGQPEAGGELSD